MVEFFWDSHYCTVLFYFLSHNSIGIFCTTPPFSPRKTLLWLLTPSMILLPGPGEMLLLLPELSMWSESIFLMDFSCFFSVKCKKDGERDAKRYIVFLPNTIIYRYTHAKPHYNVVLYSNDVIKPTILFTAVAATSTVALSLFFCMCVYVVQW